MSSPALGLLAAFFLLVANLVFLAFRGRALLTRYLPRESFSSLTLVWGTTMVGAFTFYLSRFSSSLPPGGWGGEYTSGSVIAAGVTLMSLGWINLLIDARTRLLPDEITALMAGETLLIVVLTPTLVPVQPHWFAAIVASALVWTAPLLGGWRLRQVGLGDVKLAPVLGALVATTSFTLSLLGLLLAFLFAAVHALLLRARGASKGSRFALGPHLLVAAFLCWAGGVSGPFLLGASGL